ncbi:MAG: hypothetical protein RTU92_00370 [Candidatus Thorarchaeota archaeon]
MKSDEYPVEEYSSLLNDPTTLNKKKGEVLKSLNSRSSKASHVIIFTVLGILILFLELVFVFAWYSSGGQIYDLSNLIISDSPAFVVSEITIILYWIIYFSGFLSAWRVIRIFNQYTLEYFEDHKNLRILTFQNKSHSSIISGEPLDTSTDNHSSFHYGFRSIATKLIRRGRGLYILFSAFVIETLTFLIIFGDAVTVNIGFTLYMMFSIVVLALFLILSFSGMDFLETELAVHSILDKSKWNLAAIYDALLHKLGAKLAQDIEGNDITSIKTRIDSTKMLHDYALSLPSWTINAKFGGSVIAVFLTQLAAFILNLLLNFQQIP